MKFILLCILLFACNFSGNAIHFFNGTYEEALQLAKKEKKNLFISFTASWCGPCRMMKKVVFEDPQVVRYADQHYICLNADIEYPEFRLLQCRVNPNRAGIIPHICILTPDGKIIKESSSVTTGQMMKFLKTDPQAVPLRDLVPANSPSLQMESPHLFQYRTPYSQVLAQAKRENKNMLLCFSSHFCGPCRQMEETIFQNPGIIQTVGERCIPGYFEIGDLKDRALCYRYHNTQTAIPYLVLVSPDEKILRRHTGYMDSTAFMNFLQPAASALDSISPQTFHLQESEPTCFQKFLYKQRHHAWKLQITAAINTTTLKTSGSLSAVDFNYRIGYEVGFSFAHQRKHWAVMPGLYFTSKGGKNQEVTIRQNYLELPVKFTWLYQDRQNGWWKGLSVSPYGAVRIGEKLKNNTGYGNGLFKTSPWDYGLRFATNMRLTSFDFEFGYLLGLGNISDVQGGKMYNRGFFLNMSLCF